MFCNVQNRDSEKFSLQATEVTWLTRRLIVGPQIWAELCLSHLQHFLLRISLAKHVYEQWESWLIRRHVDQQARVFHLTASVVNSRRSVCEQRAGLQNHMLSKHVESALDQERPEISTHTRAQV